MDIMLVSQWLDIRTHDGMITTISLGTICPHTKLLQYYWPYYVACFITGGLYLLILFIYFIPTPDHHYSCYYYFVLFLSLRGTRKTRQAHSLPSVQIEKLWLLKKKEHRPENHRCPTDKATNGCPPLRSLGPLLCLTSFSSHHLLWFSHFPKFSPSWSLILENLIFWEKDEPWEFAAGPVVRTPCFHCRGPGFNPWLGN